MKKQMHEKALLENPFALECVLGVYRTQEMCEKAVEIAPWLLKFVSDWLVTHELAKMREDDGCYNKDSRNKGLVD